jgi:hypothetical protein
MEEDKHWSRVETPARAEYPRMQRDPVAVHDAILH